MFHGLTGRCNRALTCPYSHDPSRLSICPKFLRHTCAFPASSCPLSHNPTAHNTPSCVHFQATPTCRNGIACLYPHVRVSEDAGVCDAFAREGWCDAEAGTCPKLHVWECGEWRETGTCSRGRRCGLRHVLRAEVGRGSLGEARSDGLQADQEVFGRRGSRAMPIEGGFEDGSSFIGLGEPGSPLWSSDEASDGEDEGEHGGSDDSEEDSQAEEQELAEEDEEVRIKGKARDLQDPTVPQQGPEEASMDSDGDADDDEVDEDAVLGVVF